MITPIRNAKDFWAGAIYLAIALTAIFIARNYDMGSATRMGPAYFPVLLGGLLALVGVASIVRSFFGQDERIGALAIRGMILVSGATVLFAVLLRGAGLVVSLIALVLVSSYASIKFRWTSAIALAIGLAAFCVLVFVKGLGVPLPLVGPWFGG